MKSLALATLIILSGCAASGGPRTDVVHDPVGPDKVVYHLNSGLEQASNGLRNIRNHLEVNPKAHIVVVAHAQGVDYLLKGNKDANGNSFEQQVSDLKLQGVQFDVCEITLRNRKMSRAQFIGDASFVPSGVAEIARLQAREGYAYLRP
jgi:intracellular sulfur oxidation DsrE/DsrF family protein